MACGVPVIVSHSSSLPEVVGKAGILIDPYQPDELFQALQQVLLDQELLENLHKKSVAQAALFSWKRLLARRSSFSVRWCRLSTELQVDTLFFSLFICDMIEEEKRSFSFSVIRKK